MAASDDRPAGNDPTRLTDDELARLLLERPADPDWQQLWDDLAARIHDYRRRWDVTDNYTCLGLARSQPQQDENEAMARMIRRVLPALTAQLRREAAQRGTPTDFPRTVDGTRLSEEELERLLIGRPRDPCWRRLWDDLASEVQTYRWRWNVVDKNAALGGLHRTGTQKREAAQLNELVLLVVAAISRHRIHENARGLSAAFDRRSQAAQQPASRGRR